MTNYLNELLATLESDLRERPCPSLVLAARYLIGEFDREALPDWVAALAGADIQLWRAAIEVAIADMEVNDG